MLDALTEMNVYSAMNSCFKSKAIFSKYLIIEFCPFLYQIRTIRYFNLFDPFGLFLFKALPYNVESVRLFPLNTFYKKWPRFPFFFKTERALNCVNLHFTPSVVCLGGFF